MKKKEEGGGGGGGVARAKPKTTILRNDCIRPGKLSFTHKLFGEEEAELDVCEAGKSTPEDKIVRWWIFCAMQIAAQFGNCQDGGIEGAECLGLQSFALLPRMLQQKKLGLR